jgi:hypothetical protein
VPSVSGNPGGRVIPVCDQSESVYWISNNLDGQHAFDDMRLFVMAPMGFTPHEVVRPLMRALEGPAP